MKAKIHRKYLYKSIFSLILSIIFFFILLDGIYLFIVVEIGPIPGDLSIWNWLKIIAVGIGFIFHFSEGVKGIYVWIRPE